jgi:hypothetical protein
MAGCQTINALNKTQQPKFREVPYLLNISGAQEIRIISPRKETYGQNGQLVSIEPVLDQKGEPVLASFKIKDQTFEQPKGIWDFGGTALRAVAIAWGLDGAYDVIKEGIKQIRDPRVITQESVRFNETVVTPNPSGSFQVDNFTG